MATVEKATRPKDYGNYDDKDYDSKGFDDFKSLRQIFSSTVC